MYSGDLNIKKNKNKILNLARSKREILEMKEDEDDNLHDYLS